MKGLGVTSAMVIIQCFDVGLNTIMKAETTRGMSNFVFVVYSNASASLFLLPFTFICHRKEALPPITVSIIRRIFLLALLSCSVQKFLYTGIKYSSPTLSSAMLNNTPAFTFMLAIIFRMEKLELKEKSSQAKSIGTVASITGALIMTLYKGMPLYINASGFPHDMVSGRFLSGPSNWVIGGFFLAVGSFCLSLFLIVQTWIIKVYPAELMVTSINCAFVTVLSAIVALIAEKNEQAWILRSNMEFIAVIYSAVLVVSTRNIVHAWACRKKGPLYVALFKPLGIVIALVLGVLFLGDALYLGSMVGAATIAFGFYAVIWGKDQEEKKVNESLDFSFVSTTTTAPLLQDRNMDV